MNIFRRVEKKYLLNEKEYQILISKIKEHLVEDIYFKSKIRNLYFDNDNNDLIIKSLEKPPFKEKIRLRSYGNSKMTDIVYLELKGKSNGVVFKRRVKLTLNDFYNYINKGIIPNNSQIMKEIDYRIKNMKLKPKLYLAYDRLSYYDKENKNFRITFDQNIRSRWTNLKIEDDQNNKIYFEKPIYIMEVKTLGSLPLWFIKELSNMKIYPQPFSKYGNIYLKELKESRNYV